MTTNANPESDKDTAAKAIEFVIEQRLKEVNTALPGIVQSFDASTRRAQVKAAIPRMTRAGQVLERSTIHNVPVVFPSAGGYTLSFPLVEGDAVLLVYAQQGIGNFKTTHGRALPTPEGGFAQHDAIAIPGFGPLTITPISGGVTPNLIGMTLQANDASRFININDTNITIGGDVFVTGNLTVGGTIS